MSNKRIYLDLWSFRQEKDLKKWFSEFEFPCSHSFFIEIENKVASIFDDIINTYPDREISELVQISYDLYILLSNTLYYWHIYQETLENRDRQYIYSDQNNYLNIFSSRNLSDQRLRELLTSSLGPILEENIYDSHWGQWLKRELRKIKYNIKFNFPRIIHGCENTALHARDIMLEYIREKKISVCQEIPEKYLQGKKIDDSTVKTEDVEKITDVLLCKYVSLCKHAYETELPVEVLDNLRALIFNRFFNTLKTYRSIVMDKAKRKQKRFFRLSGDKQLVRMIGLAVMRNGGESIGFKHGEPILYDTPFYRWGEFSSVSKFSFHSVECNKLGSEINGKYPLYNNRTLEFMDWNTNKFLQFYKKSGRNMRVKRQDIMLVGRCYLGNHVISEGIVDMVLLELEIRIIETLKKCGYNVYYKPHPDGLYKTGILRTIINELGINIIEEPFEEVMDMVDGYFFISTKTTAIGYALATDKSIVSLRLPWEHVINQQLGLLEKRVIFIDTCEDSRGRILFDTEELNGKLAARWKETIDHSFFMKYMVPPDFKI